MTHYHITVIDTYYVDGEPNHDHVGQHDHITLDEAIVHAADCVRVTSPEFGMDICVSACDGECTFTGIPGGGGCFVCQPV